MNLTLHPVLGSSDGGVTEQKQAARTAVERSALLSTLPMERREAWRKDDNDAPRPTLGTHWSLSHSAGWVAGLAARHRVGIDVEQHRLPLERSRPEILESLLDDAECELLALSDLSEITPQIFCRAWTAKEAALKAVRMGLLGLSRMKLEEIDATSARLIYEGKTLYATLRECEGQGERAGFTLAVASKEAHTIHWHGLPSPASLSS